LVNLGPSLGTERRDLQLTMAAADRLMRRSPVWSTIYTQDDIKRMGFKDVTSYANAGAGRLVDESCVAIVDGIERSVPLWMLNADEVESIEVYGTPAFSSRQRTAGQVSTTRRQPTQRNSQNCAQVYVWLKK